MSTASGERLAMLHESRKLLYSLPEDQFFELAGRPNVVYSIKNYTPDKVAGAQECRSDMPFLFKAFETGQIGPRRLSKLVGDKPRNATIHEYLDWTVTGVEAKQENEYDFSGFRLLVLLPRERVMWPAPGQYDKPEARKHAALGAPLDPLPALQVKGKPLSAATIRTGPGYIEVPFVATHENKRGRGFGRCVVEAIEEVARALGVGKLLLCSTCETSVSATWRHLGFEESSEALLRSWDVEDTDLVHMQNTLQMHKLVPPARRWRPLVIRHQAFVARVYMPADRRALSGKSQRSARPGRHDMGAASGYGRSSRATSAATTGGGSLSNASYGGGDEQQDGGDEQQQPQPRQAAAAAAQQQLLLAAPPLALPEQQPVDEQQQQAVQQPMDGMLIDQHHHHHHQQALGGPLLLNGPGGHYGGAPQPQPQSPTLVDEAMPAAMMMMDTGAGLI